MALDDGQRHETRNTARLWTGLVVVQATANIAIGCAGHIDSFDTNDARAPGCRSGPQPPTERST